MRSMVEWAAQTLAMCRHRGMVAKNPSVPAMDAPRRTITRARQLRRALTPPEVRLWLALRPRPHGLKFRRQHPVGPFVLDFYCDEAKLAVEVDGAVHDIVDVALADRQREAWLAEQGIAVLRFRAIDIFRHLDDVVDAICRTARAAPSDRFAATSPNGGGERVGSFPRPLGEGDHAQHGGVGSAEL